jgi:predicted enzyme related to lactoylglutathione lyase
MTTKKVKATTPRPMLERVAFTMFQVEDAARARAFYEDVLGLERGLASPDGMWTEYDLPGGGCLALFCHPNGASRPGGASVAFEVVDLDLLNQRLKAAGVVYTSDVIRGPNCRMSNIVDSEGNALVLHELARAPKPSKAAAGRRKARRASGE